MAQQLFPRYASDLLDLLDAQNPASCQTRKESHEEHLRRAGARELIEKLKDWRALSDTKARESLQERPNVQGS